MSKHSTLTVGIDFDGTLATREKYPAIGTDVGAIPWLLGLMLNPRVELILWTMREGTALQAAVDWCAERNLVFDQVNEIPSQDEWANHDGPCRKLHFSILVDDCALGVPLVTRSALDITVLGDRYSFERKPYVDWDEAGPALIRKVTSWLNEHSEED